jgi:hypothetical protein
MRVPVEGDSSLFRDSESGAILNCSENEFNVYLETKRRKLVELEEINYLKNKVSEIDKIKEDLGEMKDMMKLIVSKLEFNS